MALHHSPRIVTSGLVLALDAADRNSYPGSGTTWSDLAGTNNGTLTNGPTFNSGSGGSIVFDGVDDFTALPIYNYGTGNYTWSFWLKTSTQSGAFIGQGLYGSNTAGLLYGSVNPGGSNNKVRFFVGSGGGNQNKYIDSNDAVFSNNIWFNVTITWDFSSKTLLMYINGIQPAITINSTGTVSTLTPNATAGRFQTIGTYDDSRVGMSQFAGNIASALIYNRALSATEILQNYNATKTRFGL